MPTPESFVPVAITDRSGLDESVHYGAVVALGPCGEIEFAVGDPLAVVYPRSSNKPMQAVAMVRAGLSLPPDLLALVCASHDGTPMHTDGALRILAGAGLDEGALANTRSLPLDQAAAEAVLRAGLPRTSLLMNCSGKHSGMLATCVRNGWAHDASYLAVDHPLQLAITAAIDELAAETPTVPAETVPATDTGVPIEPPPRLDLDCYPYLPKAMVEKTRPASYMRLLSSDAEDAA